MLHISNFGSSRNCKSSPVHAYLKKMGYVPSAKPKSSGMLSYAAVWYAQSVVNTLLYGEIY